MINQKDLKILCHNTLPLIKDVSKFILQEQGKVTLDKIETKDKNSLVSYVDKTAEEMLVEGLSTLLPEAEFLTEEGTVDQNSGPMRWIIDPLDGTTNFLHNIPHYAISVGLEVDGKLCLGIVEHVPHQEQYYAWSGGGAYMNGSPISVSSNELVSSAVVATGFPYSSQNEEAIAKAIVHWMKNARSIRRFGAAALDMIYVAKGIFDFYYELSLNAWDIAGGAVIVKEAGGNVSDFSGTSDFLKSGQVFCSNAALHEEVIEQLQMFFKDGTTAF